MTSTSAVRERILNHGFGIASAQGLHALSMGEVARELSVSKSGLIAHFASNESLQLGVLEQAATMFQRDVGDAATGAGEERVRALFVRWIAWSRAPHLRGGCPFVHASAEADSLAPEVRAYLKQILDQWSQVLAGAIDEAKATTFRADIDSAQLVFELYGLYLSHHFWHWSMRDQTAYSRTMKAFDRLIATARRA